MRPGAQKGDLKTTQEKVEFLIENFNVNTPDANTELKETAPVTAELVSEVAGLNPQQLERLQKAANYGGDQQ